MLIMLLILMFILLLLVLLALFFGKVNGKGKQKEVPEIEEYKLKDKEIEKLSQSFVSRDEKYIASLGNGYIMNYLTTQSVQKGFAFLSNKRVYFKGNCLSGTGKNLVKTNEERTVDVKNITGSGFIYRRAWGKILVCILSIMVFIIFATVSKPRYPISECLSEIQEYEMRLECIKNPDSIEISWHGFSGEKSEYKFCYDDNDATIIMREWSGENGTYYMDEDKEIIESIFKLTEYKDEVRDMEDKIDDYKERFKESCIKTFIGLLNISASIVSIILLISKYLLIRKTLFRLEYAGGCIAFDVSFYAKAEIDDFQKQLRRTKDLAEETATIKTVAVETPVQAPAQSSVPDDLRKYADLLKEGLISQEEYDAMKKKILGL